MEAPRDADVALVRACQDPSSEEFEAAFEALYQRYKDRVYSIAYRITGTSADAMDVAQETFGLLFRKIAGFRFESSFSTWLFRIVVNCSIDHLRQERSRNGRIRTWSAIQDPVEPPDAEAPDPIRVAEEGELEEHVHRALQRLSPKLRAVLVLRYLEGLSYEEVREALGVSMGTVKSRLARAHLALERVLAGTLESFGYAPESVEGGAA